MEKRLRKKYLRLIEEMNQKITTAAASHSGFGRLLCHYDVGRRSGFCWP